MHTHVLILSLATFLSLGCESTRTASTGIPTQATLIGQGKGFVYIAPADGRIYRKREGKIDGVRLIRKGDTYKSLGPVEGDDPTKDFDEYEYYFEPAAMSNTPPPTYR